MTGRDQTVSADSQAGRAHKTGMLTACRNMLQRGDQTRLQEKDRQDRHVKQKDGQ